MRVGGCADGIFLIFVFLSDPNPNMQSGWTKWGSCILNAGMFGAIIDDV